MTTAFHVDCKCRLVVWLFVDKALESMTHLNDLVSPSCLYVVVGEFDAFACMSVSVSLLQIDS